MKSLESFIKKARKRGFSDSQIRTALAEHNWPESAITNAFEKLNPKFKLKNQVCIFIPNEILESLEKRAKKNAFTLQEQIEDILRRSSIRKKTSIQGEKIDDLLVSVFSRSPKGRKRN